MEVDTGSDFRYISNVINLCYHPPYIYLQVYEKKKKESW